MHSTNHDVVRAFCDANFDVEEVDAVLALQLLVKWGISASELVQRYDVCAMERGWDSSVTSERLQKVADALSQESPKHEQEASALCTPPSKIALQTEKRKSLLNALLPISDLGSDANGQNQHTPASGTPSTSCLRYDSVKRPRLQSTFKVRTKVGEAQATLNSHIESEGPLKSERVCEAATGSCQEVLLLGSCLKIGHRYGQDPVECRVAYLEDRIMRCERRFAASGLGTCHAVGAPSQDALLYVGRICCEGGQLTDSNLLLEGSIATSEGVRVALDLSHLSSYRIFPGQIVGVIATNPSGKTLKALQLHTSQPCSRHSSRPSNLTEPRLTGASCSQEPGEALCEDGVNLAACSMAVAAGPYTTAADSDYEPLRELLSLLHLQAHTPAALVLTGPFLDEEHPDVQSGFMADTFQHAFETKVLQPISDWASENPGTRVLMIPSTRDVMAAPVFPAPPIVTSDDLPENLTMLSNPATFSLGEVTYGVSSSDIMKALAAAELARPAVQGNRMASLASHIIAQRSYYPQFPPARGTMLDTTLAIENLNMSIVPDILIVPSDLTGFVSVVSLPEAEANKPKQYYGDGGQDDQAERHGTIVLNPGRLARGSTGGSWAKLYISPANSVTQNDMNVLSSAKTSLSSRCRVDIVRI